MTPEARLARLTRLLDAHTNGYGIEVEHGCDIPLLCQEILDMRSNLDAARANVEQKQAMIDELVRTAANLQHPSRVVRAAQASGIIPVLMLGVEEISGSFKLIAETAFLQSITTVEKRREVIVAIADSLARQVAAEPPTDG